MDLELTADHRDLDDLVAKVVDRHAPVSLSRSLLEQCGDPSAFWGQLDALGLADLGPGDDGPGVVGLCLIAGRMGRTAAPNLVGETAVLRDLGVDLDSVATPVVFGVMSTSGMVNEGGRPSSLGPAYPTLTLHRTGDDGLRLQGTLLDVRHGSRAATLAAVARDGETQVLVLVPAAAAGLTLAAPTGIDPGREAVTVTFDSVEVAVGDVIGIDPDRFEAALALGALISAAEGLGSAGAVLDDALDHVRSRRQFGRPIGQFQALQHVLADAYVRRESAWSTVLFAAATYDEDLGSAVRDAWLAKAVSARAMRDITEAALQALGGIAFTWELDAHILQRRALSCESAFGDGAHHEQLVELSLLKGSLG